MQVETTTIATTSPKLVDCYRAVRNFSLKLCETLSPEDCTIQSMPDASPTRWHLAHTTWFFETFLLRERGDYRRYSEDFEVLFNSYYNTVGEQFPRPHRGLLSRPSLGEVLAYRDYVDEQMVRLLNDRVEEVDSIVTLGLQHEQQHQELMLTDIKHMLGRNPLEPVYRDGNWHSAQARGSEWLEFDEGLYEIGHSSQPRAEAFAFDNESPVHRHFLPPFRLASQLVTCGDFMRFIDDGGYQKPELWLSEGWNTANNDGWQAPLYWRQSQGQWSHFTLGGQRPVDMNRPVCHVSYFEADAYARWAGLRLPTEFEWEVAALDESKRATNQATFADSLIASDDVVHPIGSDALMGDVWQWTASQYTAYPGYVAPAGALGEYNGKFMCNQFVLRGGSCATHSTHARATYRNFFAPAARWQFSGIRLAK